MGVLKKLVEVFKILRFGEISKKCEGSVNRERTQMFLLLFVMTEQ